MADIAGTQSHGGPADLTAAKEHIKELEQALEGTKGALAGALGSNLVFADSGEEGEALVGDGKVVLIAKKKMAVGRGSRPHLLIEGDNLQSLELLADGYKNRIDVIYIDPPYNTGNTGFRYSDKFTESGDRHGAWLGFMRRRLRLAIELMADNGVIFISIDDREYAHLKLLCDDLFGERNRIATLVWHSKYTVANDSRHFSRQHEYVLVYGRSKEKVSIGRLPRTAKANAAYRNPDNDPRGPWKATPIHAKSGNAANSYKVTFPNGTTWTPPAGRFPRYSKTRLLEMYNDGRLSFGSSGASPPSAKTYLSEVGGIVPGSILNYDLVGHTHGANEELATVLGKGVFDNPKPLALLTTLISLGTEKKDAVVLDFFAGSGTTAHAVAILNREDGGARQAILCTNNENDICRNVTWARMKAVLTGRYPTGHTETPLPGSLRYYEVSPPASMTRAREALLALRLGLHDVRPLIPGGAAVELSNGEESAVLVHRFSAEVAKAIGALSGTKIYATNDIREQLQALGAPDIEVLG